MFQPELSFTTRRTCYIRTQSEKYQSDYHCRVLYLNLLSNLVRSQLSDSDCSDEMGKKSIPVGVGEEHVMQQYTYAIRSTRVW